MVPVIFESPDGGKTVYARQVGSTNRTQIHSVSTIAELNRHAKLEKWKEILLVSETNPTLSSAIEQAEIIYELVKKDSLDENS